MLYLVDHTPNRRRVFENAAPMALVQAEPFERRLLIGAPADRAAGLHHGEQFLLADHAVSRLSPSRRPRISPTFLPRRAATARGFVARPSATKAALIMLCGLALPTDLATTS